MLPESEEMVFARLTAISRCLCLKQWCVAAEDLNKLYEEMTSKDRFIVLFEEPFASVIRDCARAFREKGLDEYREDLSEMCYWAGNSIIFYEASLGSAPFIKWLEEESERNLICFFQDRANREKYKVDGLTTDLFLSKGKYALAFSTINTESFDGSFLSITIEKRLPEITFHMINQIHSGRVPEWCCTAIRLIFSIFGVFNLHGKEERFLQCFAAAMKLFAQSTNWLPSEKIRDNMIEILLSLRERVPPAHQSSFFQEFNRTSGTGAKRSFSSTSSDIQAEAMEMTKRTRSDALDTSPYLII